MNERQEVDLPLDIIAKEPAATATSSLIFRKRYLLVLLAPVLMFSGAVIGMYFQPPALQKFYALTGLQPGAGSAAPIALPPNVVLPKPCQSARNGDPGSARKRGSDSVLMIL